MALVLTPLCDSFICRLCCCEFTFGLNLFESDPDANNVNLQDAINKYLPLKVTNDGNLPRQICPDCHNQLTATVSFFNKIISGQNELRKMWQKESTLRKSLSIENSLYLDQSIDDDPFSVSRDEERHFYPPDCTIAVNMSGRQTTTGRPRGRPRKEKKDGSNEIVPQLSPQPFSQTSVISSEDGETLPKRRRRPPKRFLETIAGKALDHLLDQGACQPSDPRNVSPVVGHLKSKDGARLEPIIGYESRWGVRRKIKAEEGKKIVCDFCGKRFRSGTKYLCHREKHKENVVLATDLFNRTVEEHGDDSLLQCHCGFNTNTKMEMSSHTLQCHQSDQAKARVATPPSPESNAAKTNVNVKCTKCERSFVHAASLAYHTQVSHHHDQVFECSSCDKTFRHKQLLIRHQTVHSDERPFPCQECPLKFKTSSNLWNHTVIHNKAERLQCDICKHFFKYKSSLTQHLLAHQGIKSFKCEYCGKCFTAKGNMLEHIRIHTGEKPFECSVCQRRFTTSSQVNLHVKTHSGARPWQCTFCPRAFIHKDSWKTHERRHKGEKPFVCNYCNRGFAENWALKKHIRLHTGEKPYKCYICDKAFADCSNLKKHKNVHMEDKILASDLVQMLKQDTWEESMTKPHRIQSKYGKLNEGLMELAAKNPNKTLLDEGGTPLSLSLPNGRFVKLLTVDADGILHAVTSDGWTIQLQMPPGCNIEDDNMLDLIRDAIMAINPKETQDDKEELGDNATLLLCQDQGEGLLDSSLSDISNAILLAADGDTNVAPGSKNVYFI